MLHGELARGPAPATSSALMNGVRDGSSADVDTDDGKDVVGAPVRAPVPGQHDSEWLDGLGLGVAGELGRRRRGGRPRSTGRRARRPSSPTAASGTHASPASRVPLLAAGLLVLRARSACSASTSSSQRTSQRGTARSDRRASTTTPGRSRLSYVLTGENASYKGVMPREALRARARAAGARSRSRRATTSSTSTTTPSTRASRIPTVSASEAQGVDASASTGT